MFRWPWSKPALPLPDHPNIFPAPLPAIVAEYAISPSGVAFLQQHEGLRLQAYLDSAGIPTIGYGTIRVNGQPVHLGQTCTAEQASQWLTLECNGIAKALRNLVNVPLNQKQIDALVDFCYNLGTDAFRGSSLCRAINLRQPIVADLFTRWDKIHKDGQIVEVPGLFKRRNDEYTLYTS